MYKLIKDIYVTQSIQNIHPYTKGPLKRPAFFCSPSFNIRHPGIHNPDSET